ncbi:hypothetical protein C1J05_14930 [Sulfitobacter sp. JL08]|uniref:hypothetical protein n=1 Tax=Sulfitobacter sp. JL08 TaxID=2070369 RepID=UPI000E0C5ED5|nr:hypothetical protein [Sulfitobacter sp. JL08]AXI55624.1 hypothetical protein C1J05_14930 [Sulfitobacter sp. JL08]
MVDQADGVNKVGTLVKLARNAEKLHQWPDEIGITPTELPALSLFHKMQGQRAFSDWSAMDIVELARLAKMTALYEQQWATYVAEGPIIMGGRRNTTPIQNPRGRVCTDLSASINTLARRLNLNGLSTSEKRSMSKRSEAESEMRATHEGNSADDLSLI